MYNLYKSVGDAKVRLRLSLNSERDFISLPLHHNTILQAMLYRSLPPEISKFLHDIGFFYEKRRFKLFTFSKIFSPRYRITSNKEGKKFVNYKTPIELYVSSALKDITTLWGEKFLKSHEVKLGKNSMYLDAIEVLTTPDFKEEMLIKTLSPITAYRTFENGKKFYRYYSPEEPEFNELLKENLRKKYKLLTNEDIEDFPFEIQPEKNIKKVLLKYKDFPIEAYEGIFRIKTDPEKFKFVYDAGLGAKNSQGFGMIEVIEDG